VISVTPWLRFTPGKDPVPILQEVCEPQGQSEVAGKSRPHRDSIRDRSALSQSLYRLSYPAEDIYIYKCQAEKGCFRFLGILLHIASF